MVKMLGYMVDEDYNIATIEFEPKDGYDEESLYYLYSNYKKINHNYLRPYYTVLKIENIKGVEESFFKSYTQCGKIKREYKGRSYKFFKYRRCYDICYNEDEIKSDIIRNIMKENDIFYDLSDLFKDFNPIGDLNHIHQLYNITHHVKKKQKWIDIMVGTEKKEYKERIVDEFMIFNGIIEGERRQNIDGLNIVTNYINGVCTEIRINGRDFSKAILG
jgi:hypothetical protein